MRKGEGDLRKRAEHFCDVVRETKETETPAISEVFGMNRLGFPIIDEDKSIENVRKIAVFEPLTEEQLRRSSLGGGAA